MIPYGYNIIECEEIDSTNTELCRLFKSNKASHNTVVVAQRQTQGKGRSGRDWQSLDGNLCASILVELPTDGDVNSTLTCLAAAAVRKTILSIPGWSKDVGIKWPNDVLIEGKKIAGILAESLVHPQTKQRVVVLGIGMNIAMSPSVLSYPTTHLNAHIPKASDRHVVLQVLLGIWQELYAMWCKDAKITLSAHWLPFMEGIGGQGKWVTNQETLSGTIRSFHTDGSLSLLLESGEEKSVRVGEVLSV